MLKTFRVRNFQSLRDVVVEFGPTVTTIVGSNDVGKSAIMRALQLVCLNKLALSPDKYIRHGRNKFDLELTLTDGTVIRRVKSSKSNLYFLDGRKMQAFGKNKLPDQIARKLNIGRENFQRQQDQHFWFSDTPGEVSRKLNAMVNLGLIDSSLKKLNELVRSIKSDLNDKRERAKRSKAILDSLELVPILDVELGKLEKLDRLRRKTSREAQELSEGVRAMQDARKGRKAARIALRAGKRAVKAGLAHNSAVREAEELETTIRELERSKKAAAIQIPDIRPLIALRAKGDQLAEEERQLRHLIEDLELKEAELWTRKGNLERLKRKLAKASPKKCPTCGRSLRSKPSSQGTGTCH